MVWCSGNVMNLEESWTARGCVCVWGSELNFLSDALKSSSCVELVVGCGCGVLVVC